MKKIGRSITRILSVFVAAALVVMTGATPVHALEKLLGEENNLETIYRWTRANTQEELNGLVQDAAEKGLETRLLLVPVVYDDYKHEPGFERYYILDNDTDRFAKVGLSENPAIAHNEEVFYTRSGFRTPILKYEGMVGNEVKDTIETFGTEVPSFLIYETGTDDKKTGEILVAKIGDFWDGMFHNTDAKQYVIPESGENGLSSLNSRESCYKWVIGFPLQADTYTSRELNDNVFSRACKDLVQVGTWMEYYGYYFGLDDDRIASASESAMTPLHRTRTDSQVYLSETLYKCFIGVKEKEVEVIDKNLTLTNETRVFDGTTLIKDYNTVTVGKGATLFISGRCALNGALMITGGKVIVQRGAVLGPMNAISPNGNATGGIWVLSGGELIIRDGARYANFSPNLGSGALCVSGSNSRVINRGIIAARRPLWVRTNGELLNQGYIYTGCTIANGMAITDYTTSKGLTAQEYARKVTSSFTNQITSSYTQSGIILRNTLDDYDTGIFTNEGTFKVY